MNGFYMITASLIKELTIPVSYVSESFSQIEIKVFILTLLYGTSKGFVKAFKAFTKPFEAIQKCENKNLS